MNAHTCEHCAERFESKSATARFCSDRCRAAWHREHAPAGEITGCRRLKSGGVSVTIRFDETEAERALRFLLKQKAYVGIINEEGKQNGRSSD